jgi:predicted metalloprotease
VAPSSGGGGPVPQTQQQGTNRAPATDRETVFVKTVLADTEDVWTQLFREQRAKYAPPTLTLFDDRTGTACGTGQSATGPFYCPADQHVYIDLSFFRLMQQRFKVSGEFAQAYVIAHEVGHHVQNQLGISDQVHKAQQSASESQGNALSVKLELQADCFAGVWANHSNSRRAFIEQGDVDQALQTASAIGDDRLQKQTQGYVVPDAFTHGSSEQRKRWFLTGFQQGSVQACNTFGAAQP